MLSQQRAKMPQANPVKCVAFGYNFVHVKHISLSMTLYVAAKPLRRLCTSIC